MNNSSNDEQVPTGAPPPEGEPVAAIEPPSLASVSDAGEPEPDPPVVHSADGDKVDAAAADLKANQLSSVEDLIRFAYQQNGKRLSVPSAVVRKIAAGSQLEDDAAEPLFTLVVELLDKDPILAVPPRVLAFAASAKPAPHLRRRLEKTMEEALSRHAMFDGGRLREALDDPPSKSDLVLDGLRKVADCMTPERLGIHTKTLKPSHRDKLYVNATTSLTLLLALRDDWTVDAVFDVLYRRLWRNSTDTVERLASIGAMADARDVAVLASLGRVFDRQRGDAERLTRDAQSAAERALRRAVSADAELADRDDKIRLLDLRTVDLARENDGLRESLAAEDRSRVHDRSHHVDAYAALRTRIVRVLDKQVELLSEGLHALREGATEVTEEFTDRTITALSREVAQLRRHGGDG